METSANHSGNKTYKKVKRVGCSIALILLLVIAGFVYWRYYFTYSEGERFGLLQKFSHKGNLFKTYEGEMILSSVQSNANVPIASEKFFFSVTEKPVAEQLMKFQGRHVTVHYKQKKATLPWRGESDYIVDSVRVEQ